MRITSFVTQDGVGRRCLVVICLSFYCCQTMTYALLKFLDANRVKCLPDLLVCCIVIGAFLPGLK